MSNMLYSHAKEDNMTILEFLARKKMTQKDFALYVGIDRSYLNQILQGKRRISPERAITIYEKTQGLVTRDEAIFPEYYKEWSL